MRALSVDAADGHRSVRADLLIADRLAALLRDKGRDLYAEFDRQAAELLARGRREKDPRLLEDVGRSYPAARVVPEAWMALGELYEELRRPGDAARAYKRLLAVAPDDAAAGPGLWGLARAYEAQKLWVSARDAYLQALTRFADQRVEQIGPGLAPRPRSRRSWPGSRSPGWRATGRSRQCRSRSAADGTVGGSTPPTRSPPRGSRPRPRRAGSSWSWAARSGRSTRPRASRPGRRPRGRAGLGRLPGRPDHRRDEDPAGALSLDKAPSSGSTTWGSGRPQGRGQPVRPRPAAEAGRASPSTPLQDFRIVGSRIFCLRGDQALMAFDGDTGLLDWS